MTVAELMEKLAKLPPEMRVVVEDGEMGMHDDACVYRIPVNIDRRFGAHVSNFDTRYHEESEDAVLLSRWGQNDNAVEL